MERLGNGYKLNTGDFLHIFEVVVMIVSFVAAVARFDAKFDQNAAQVIIHTQQLNRMEHYLASKDPEYYKRSKDDE